MSVDPATATEKAGHMGHTYYFCSAGCRQAFEKDPARYLAPESSSPRPFALGGVTRPGCRRFAQQWQPGPSARSSRSSPLPRASFPASHGCDNVATIRVGPHTGRLDPIHLWNCSNRRPARGRPRPCLLAGEIQSERQRLRPQPPAEDGDAAFLDPGTPIYQIRDEPPADNTWPPHERPHPGLPGGHQKERRP